MKMSITPYNPIQVQTCRYCGQIIGNFTVKVNKGRLDHIWKHVTIDGKKRECDKSYLPNSLKNEKCYASPHIKSE